MLRYLAPRALVILALAAAPALAQEVPPGVAPSPAPRTLQVHGSAEITAAPELAIVTLAVETEAAEAATAAADNAERTARVIAALRDRIGDGGRVTTVGYSLSPRYVHDEGGREPRISGYVAQNQVRAETGDLPAVGELLDAAIAAGANRVDGLQFTLAEESPRKREALAAAAADARAQAATLAAALGVGLGEVVSATTTEAAVPIPMPYARMAMESAQATPIEPGEVTVRATVRVVFAIGAGE